MINLYTSIHSCQIGCEEIRLRKSCKYQQKAYNQENQNYHIVNVTFLCLIICINKGLFIAVSILQLKHYLTPYSSLLCLVFCCLLERLLKMSLEDLREFLQEKIAASLQFEDDIVIEQLQASMAELRKMKFDLPPPGESKSQMACFMVCSEAKC